MDFIVNFFKNILNGPTYYIVSIISILIIFTIIGYVLDQIKSQNEKKVNITEIDESNNALINKNEVIIEEKVDDVIVFDEKQDDETESL